MKLLRIRHESVKVFKLTDCVHIENDKKFKEWDQILMKTELFDNVIHSEKVFYEFR